MRIAIVTEDMETQPPLPLLATEDMETQPPPSVFCNEYRYQQRVCDECGLSEVVHNVKEDSA